MNCKNKDAYFSALILVLLIVCSTPARTVAQTHAGLTEKLSVGVAEFPPYSLKTENGQWKGLAIELWQAVAGELGVAFKFREYSRIKQISGAIQEGDVDVTPAVVVNAQNEKLMDLSHAFYQSGLGIAKSRDRPGLGWLTYLKRLTSTSILQVISTLCFGALIAGIFVWIFESKKNPAMFGGNIPHGLGQSLWWSIVTMTTVGYGDKAPQSLGGRIVAVLWMFFSIILITSYTAIITTSLAVGGLSDKVRSPRDLPYVRVGALSSSETLAILSQEDIQAVPFDSIENGLQAVIENEIDAFVDDEAQLKYFAKTGFPGKLTVMAQTLDQYSVSMAMPLGSPLRKPLNEALLKFMQTDAWPKLLKRYLGTAY